MVTQTLTKMANNNKFYGFSSLKILKYLNNDDTTVIKSGKLVISVTLFYQKRNVR